MSGEFKKVAQNIRKLMVRDMHTELEGKTECLKHDYKDVIDMDKETIEERCKNCDALKPLDPVDNNTVEVD